MNRLALIRKERNLTQAEVANDINVSIPTYSRYETGARKLDNQTLMKLTEYFGVSSDYLLGLDNAPKRALKKRWVPILGWIIAGPPVISEENIIGYVEMPEDAFPNDELFSLIVEGDSMYPYYMEGDIVIYKMTNRAEDGDDVAVRINGDEFTLKRLKIRDDGIMLNPINQPEYEPMFFTKKEIGQLPIEILGVVVEQRRTKNKYKNKLNGKK